MQDTFRGTSRSFLRCLGLPSCAALLALAWPAANFASYNYGLLRTGGGSFTSIGIFTATLVAILIVVAASVACFGRALLARRLLICMAATFPLLFVFQPVAQALSQWLQPLTSQAGICAGLVFLVGWCAVGVAAWRLASRSGVVAVFTVFLAVACIMPLLSIVYQSLTVHTGGANMVEGGEALAPAGARGLHDVFYIIFDSYPGLEVTDKYFHLDNRAIGAFLGGHGFFDAGNFQSNYFATFLTFTAILNARYTVDASTPAPLDMKDFYPNILRNPGRLRAVRTFKALGYQPYFVGNWYGRCKPGIFVCVERQAYWFDEAFSSFLSSTPWPSVVFRLGHASFDGNWNAVDPLLKALPQLTEAPGLKFVMAHNIPPHPPAIYNSDCSPIRDPGAPSLAWQYGKAPYEKNMACVNRKIEVLVKAIAARDPGAIVVIQSDHGSFTSLPGRLVPSKISPTTRFEISRPINFIRAPQACRQWLYKGMSQVNTMRFVLACAHDGKPDYLPDVSYADTSGSADIHGPFVEQAVPHYP